MKLKELFYFLGIKPSIKFFPSVKEKIGCWNGSDIEAYQWKTPKSDGFKLDVKLVKELTSFITPGDSAIDIGAHVGDSTIPIGLACGPEGAVFAFEPNPIVFQTLSKNSILNKSLMNIIALPFAATQDDCALDFGFSDPWLANGGDKSSFGWRGGHAFRVPVSGVNPYKLLNQNFSKELQNLKYLKIDVEGLDFYVLLQLESLINQYRPFIKFEIAKFTSAENRKNLWNFFSDKKYTFRLVGNDGVLFGQEVGEEGFYLKESCDIFCIPKAQN